MWGDFDAEGYGSVSVKGKSVLDVGSDLGTSAYYFIKRGAAQVVCCDMHHNATLKSFCGIDDRLHHVSWNRGWRGWLDDVVRYQCQVVKIDIEGGEAHLLEWPLDSLRMCDDWIIETHNTDIDADLVDRFGAAGFIVNVAREFSFNPDVRVLHFCR